MPNAKPKTPRPHGKGYTLEHKNGKWQQTNSRSVEVYMQVPGGWTCRTITNARGATLIVLTRLLADKEDMTRVIAQPVFSYTASDFHETLQGSYSVNIAKAASRRGRTKS